MRAAARVGVIDAGLGVDLVGRRAWYRRLSVQETEKEAWPLKIQRLNFRYWCKQTKQNKTKPSRVRCEEPALARLKPDSGVRANLGYTVRPPLKPTTKQQHQNDYYLVKRNPKNTWGPSPVQDTSLKIHKAQAEVPGERGGRGTSSY